MNIGVYATHPDDSALGCGGRIIQHVEDGDEVFIIIGSPGGTSHKSALGVDTPSVEEVREARKKEAERSAEAMGVNVTVLDTPGSGRIRENEGFVRKNLREISKEQEFDTVYFHSPDPHTDHSLMNQIVNDFMDEEIITPEKAYTFQIWKEEEVKIRDEDGLETTDRDSRGKKVVFDIKDEIDRKKEAIRRHRSQVLKWPYPTWRIQERPVLEKDFLESFFQDEEVFYRL